MNNMCDWNHMEAELFHTATLPFLQEMLDIMKSIYDMMGKYTYPAMREEAPREHVENFFQVSWAHLWGPCMQKTPCTGDKAGLQ